MKYTLFNIVILSFLIFGKVHSQNLSDKFEGSWEGKGTLMGAETSFKMNWDKVLNDQFMKLTFTSHRVSGEEAILFHATAMYKLDEEHWAGTWFDSRGISFGVDGTESKNTLTVEWGSPDIEQGRTVYSITDENEITVTDYVNRNGSYSKFGEAVYQRVGNAGNFSSPKVTGVGGVFLKSENPEKTREWYKKHLGLASNNQGGSFVWRKFDDSEEYGFTVWHSFARDDDYFNPSDQEFMINYRVNNLDALVTKLESAGVKLVGDVEEYPFGKFAWIMDSDGQKVELWEPYDAEYFEMLNEEGVIFHPSN